MKLRIRGDSVRLRLKQNEVDRIASGNSVTERTRFPGAELTFSLNVTDEDDLSASFDDGSLVVQLPESQAREWATTNTVSVHAEQALPGGGALSILVEKDFTCLAPGRHRDHEDDDDTYAHPDGQK